MRQQWTLNIENFGKIDQAKIELKPMMLFVGENNSGKSYLMSLLWGILTLGKGLFPSTVPTSSTYKKCEAWLQGQTNLGEFPIDKDAQILFMDLFNEMLENGKCKMVERIFTHPLGIGKIFISDFKSSVQIRAKWRSDANYGYVYDSTSDVYEIPKESDVYEIIKWITSNLILAGVRENFGSSFSKPLYLPASRTGFMLAYKTLISKYIESSTLTLFQDEVPKTRLPLSVTRFLQWLLDVNLERKADARLNMGSYIESNILQGTIKQDDSPVPNYFYRSEGADVDLPLHVTSSLITELSPLILALKSDSDFSVLIVEEPEAHLHLSMQKLLANSMIRLVNAGMPVWLTTHGDTILQQLNNMIKLFNHPEGNKMAKQHGYHSDDLLDPSKVSAYQFSTQKNGATIVENLTLSKFGFAVPTFNHTIMIQTEEAYLFQENDGDAD